MASTVRKTLIVMLGVSIVCLLLVLSLQPSGESTSREEWVDSKPNPTEERGQVLQEGHAEPEEKTPPKLPPQEPPTASVPVLDQPKEPSTFNDTRRLDLESGMMCRLSQASGKEICYETKKESAASELPACSKGVINVRSSFLYNGEIVYIVDISKTGIEGFRDTFFCSDGTSASLQENVLNEHTQRFHFRAGLIKCKAENKNSNGFYFLNHGGDCGTQFIAIQQERDTGRHTLGLKDSNTTSEDVNGPNEEEDSPNDDDSGGEEANVEKEKFKQQEMPVIIPTSTTIHFYPTKLSKSYEEEHPDREKKALLFPVKPQHEKARFQFSTCAVAAVVEDSTPFLNHWIWHMKYRVKVERVTMYVSPGEFNVNSKNLNGTFVRELVTSGFLELVSWPDVLDQKRLFLRAKPAAYSDYVYRFRGLCHFSIFLDVDDFFVSWNSNHYLAPVIKTALVEEPEIDGFQFGWPTFWPMCERNSGNSPPFETDALLRNMNYGDIESENFKHVHNTYESLDVGMHGASGEKQSRIFWPGIAVYHLRTRDRFEGNRGMNVYNAATCQEKLLSIYPFSVLKSFIFWRER